MSTSIEAAAAAVIALLQTAPNLDVFDGDVNAHMDSDGKAHPYAVLWAGPGRDNPDEVRECGLGEAKLWQFQVTAAGGDVARCRRAVDRTLAALLRKRLLSGGGLIEMAADPGTEREDRDVTPSRWFVPLLFHVPLP